jgi:hypothetical protein
MATRVISYDLGCEPSPSTPGEMMLANGWHTYLLFNAVSKTADLSGHLQQLGVAFIECKQCMVSKYGYPNDEGLAEHPLWGLGLRSAQSSILEVVDSPWSTEVYEQRIASARRISPTRSTDWVNPKDHRHFLITFKEGTFECIASSLVVDRFYLSFKEALAHFSRAVLGH